MQASLPESGSKQVPRRIVPPTEKFLQMEKYTGNGLPRRLQARASADAAALSASRSPRVENPFLVRYRRTSNTSAPKSPEGLARTCSNLGVDTLEKARDKLNSGGNSGAKLKFDPQRRSARALIGASAPHLSGGEDLAAVMELSRPPLPPPTPVRSPLESTQTKSRRISATSKPLIQLTTSGPESGADSNQQRLSLRSTPRSPAFASKDNRMSIFAAQTSMPSSPRASDKNGTLLPNTAPISPSHSLQSKSIGLHQGKSEAVRQPVIEDSPARGSASAPEPCRTSGGDSRLLKRTTETAVLNTGAPHPPNNVPTLPDSDISPPPPVVDQVSSTTSQDELVVADSHPARTTASRQGGVTIVEEPPHPADSGDLIVSSDPRTQPEHFDGTAIVPIINLAEEEVPPVERFHRKQEWLQVPSLFYLFANLIELQELQQHRQAAEVNEERKRNGSMSSSLVSSWDGEREAQLVTLQNHISYSVHEVEGLLLNSFFASWSQAGLRSLVSNATKAWGKYGPGSQQFDQASFRLLDAISADRSCTVTYTWLYSIRKYVGNMDNLIAMCCIFGALALVGILCIIFLGIFGRTHLVACIILCAILGVVIIVIYGLAMLTVHHNAYADATATFFREEALALTKTVINQDAENADNSFSGMGSTMWSTPTASEQHRGLGDNIRPGLGARDGVPRGTAEGDDGFASMIGKSLQPDDPAQLAQLEKDRQNALLMTSFNYDKHQQNMQQHQEEILRQRMDVSPLMSDVHELAQATEESRRAFQVKRLSAERNANLVAGLSEDICITALIWCRDVSVTAGIIPALWDHNFLVFSGSLAVLDNVYHHGSERFKVFLIHAASLKRGSGDMQTVMKWVQEKRPVFFFSGDISSFPAEVPITSRLEVPFMERDWYALLLAGLGIDEEVNAPPPPTQPFKVPPYTLGRRLGGGAYGNVFEAEMEETGGKCAVKRMYLREDEEDGENEDAGPSSQLREIAQEVEIMSSLSHPNIVKYMFCERDDNCISIFMELCSGGSLGSLISTGKLVDPGQVRRILTDILSAVAYLHNKRIVHRDLKPDNVLFRDGRAKVTDFGTAVLKRDRGDLRVVKGTFAYMAPEILCGEPYGKACDVWSVGCIAAEVLSVDLPQRALGMPEMCEYYRRMDMSSALDIECSVPTVKDFLCSCLQRNPSARKTAAQLLQHEMLRAENSTLDHWMDIVITKRRETHKAASGRTFAMNGSAFDLDSEASNSLKSSQILTLNDE